MILLIDNYDSFSYNLYQLVGSLNPDIKVIRNDAMTVKEIEALAPDRIILSPGPGWPKDSGVCPEVIKKLGVEKNIPVLGVCLGHQAICEVFGAKIQHAKTLMHGKQSLIKVNTSCELFKDCPEEFKAARYHSLVAANDSIPEILEVTARTIDDNEVMAVKHREKNIFGVQFHPESILTPDGKIILKNFLNVK